MFFKCSLNVNYLLEYCYLNMWGCKIKNRILSLFRRLFYHRIIQYSLFHHVLSQFDFNFSRSKCRYNWSKNLSSPIFIIVTPWPRRREMAGRARREPHFAADGSIKISRRSVADFVWSGIVPRPCVSSFPSSTTSGVSRTAASLRCNPPRFAIPGASRSPKSGVRR